MRVSLYTMCTQYLAGFTENKSLPRLNFSEVPKSYAIENISICGHYEGSSVLWASSGDGPEATYLFELTSSKK